MSEPKIRITIHLDVTLTPSDIWHGCPPSEVTPAAVMEAMGNPSSGAAIILVAQEWGLGGGATLGIDVEHGEWRGPEEQRTVARGLGSMHTEKLEDARKAATPWKSERTQPARRPPPPPVYTSWREEVAARRERQEREAATLEAYAPHIKVGKE